MKVKAAFGGNKDSFIISNDFIEREISLRDGRVKTIAIRNKATGERLRMDSAEFCVLFIDGTRVKGDSFRFLGHRVQEEKDGGLVCVFRLRHEKLGLHGEICFRLGPKDFFIRKTVSLRKAGGRKLVIDRFDVEHFSVRKELLPEDFYQASGQGRAAQGEANNQGMPIDKLGQPVFIGGNFFTGLEYPAGHNENRSGVVQLFHFPGKPAGQNGWTSKTAVFGAAISGDLQKDFLAYVDLIRKKTKPFVMLNSGGELQVYDPVQLPNMNSTMRGVIDETLQNLKKELVERRGVPFDCYQPDAGWSNPDTLYEIDRKKFPDQFKSLTRQLRQMGANLGLWLSATPPLSPALVKAEAMKKLGYEIAANRFAAGLYPCLSAPRYNKAIREVMRRHLVRHRIRHYKMDFEFFPCEARNHGHLPNLRHGFEANADALIALLQELREASPDVVLNPTSGMWLSPWWLMHAETIWPHTMWDFNYNRQPVCTSPRDWEHTNRDENVYQLLRVERCRFPFSGICSFVLHYGPRYNVAGPHEDLRSFVNTLVHSNARQLTITDKHLSSPLNMDKARWDAMAETLRWTLYWTDKVPDGTMILGRPAKGELYGYSYLGNHGGIVLLRNPSMFSQTGRVPLDALNGKDDFALEITYPCRKTLGIGKRDQLNKISKITAEPYEVIVLEIKPLREIAYPLLSGCRYAITKKEAGKITFEIYNEPGQALDVSAIGYRGIKSMRAEGGVVKGARAHLASKLTKDSVRIIPLAPRTVQGLDGAGKPFKVQTARLDIPESEKATVRIVAKEEKARLLRISANMGGWFGGLPYRACLGKGWTAYEIDLDYRDMNVISWGFPEGEPANYSVWLIRSYRLEKRRIEVSYKADKRKPAPPQLPTPFAGLITETLKVAPTGKRVGDGLWTDEYAQGSKKEKNNA